jgi:hypothetical protein
MSNVENSGPFQQQNGTKRHAAETTMSARPGQNWDGRTDQCLHGRGGLSVYDADPVGRQLLGWDSSTMSEHVAVTLRIATTQGKTQRRVLLAQRPRSRL